MRLSGTFRSCGPSRPGIPREDQVGRGEGRGLGQLRDFEAQAVVATGADSDRDLDRDVQDRDDQPEQARLPGTGAEIVDRSRAEQFFGFAFVVGPDRRQAGLRVGRALFQREVRGDAARNRVGVAEEPLGRVEGDGPRRLRDAGVFEREAGAQVGMGAGQRRRRSGRESSIERLAWAGAANAATAVTLATSPARIERRILRAGVALRSVVGVVIFPVSLLAIVCLISRSPARAPT